MNVSDKAGSRPSDAIKSAANQTQKNKAKNLSRLNGGAFRNSRKVGYSLEYSAKVTTAATSAISAAIWAASLDVPGNTKLGIATRNAINSARTADPMIRLTTLVSLQIGWSRFDAATLFQICAAGFGGLPHYCPSFAQVRGAAQLWS